MDGNNYNRKVDKEKLQFFYSIGKRFFHAKCIFNEDEPLVVDVCAGKTCFRATFKSYEN